ncbi:1-deoxy-D-xylulose-5-phosphate synthase [Streptomyces xanthochromogenes]|uniref:1-deoxy-D-xylulose-5-phosphate synthase n=1 Tax=Streptomyces xanthochromogenes TaxID=67384 RepID=UPI0038305094
MTTHAPTRPRLADLSDLRALPAGELPALAGQIRKFLIEKVCASGGHLGPNLGVVELTLALHRVFDSPRDTIVFDTGHQAYVHKLLTGRSKEFDTLRQAGGLSGYPSRSESVHDLVENSHASTALSYADGLAKARQLGGEDERAVVAVIGDGALTGGMAWEALNNLGGARERPVIVVLNDNGRSYAPTSGALAAHLAALKSGGGTEACRNLFTDLGFTYFGPIDGHDTAQMEAMLRRARAMARPTVVHVRTLKGKGYDPAETDEADCLHAVGTVDPATGRASAPSTPSWTHVFGQALLQVAAEQTDVVALTAAMLRPTGLHPMQQNFPERVFDVGIAEQHAVTSAAGLAMGGFHPVVAIYATFLNRAFDQVLMDVALHRLPVTFVLDRAGITGPDGPSHHGMWDLSILATVPGMRVAAPRDPARLRSLLRAATSMRDGPSALRIPRTTAGPDTEAVARVDGLDILHRTARRPLEVLLVAVGPLATQALDAAVVLEENGIGVTVADPRWVLPVNPALPTLAARHQLVLSVEDNTLTGGVGSAIVQACWDAGVTTPVQALGLPRQFIPQGSRTRLLAEAGLDANGIVRAVQDARKRQLADEPVARHQPRTDVTTTASMNGRSRWLPSISASPRP